MNDDERIRERLKGFIEIEPNWKNVRAWAQMALTRMTTPNEREPFLAIIAECEKAKLAGRPNTDWEEIKA